MHPRQEFPFPTLLRTGSRAGVWGPHRPRRNQIQICRRKERQERRAHNRSNETVKQGGLLGEDRARGRQEDEVDRSASFAGEGYLLGESRTAVACETMMITGETLITQVRLGRFGARRGAPARSESADGHTRDLGAVGRRPRPRDTCPSPARPVRRRRFGRRLCGRGRWCGHLARQ